MFDLDKFVQNLLTDRRTLLGQVLTVREVQERELQGVRVYDVMCPFSYSHTAAWCGFPGCSDD